AVVPARIERARVADQLVQAHPAGEIVLLGEVADAREDADRIRGGIETEDAHGAALRLEQPHDVPDERRLARAVRAAEPRDLAALERERNRRQRLLVAEAAGELGERDDGAGHGWGSIKTTPGRCSKLFTLGWEAQPIASSRPSRSAARRAARAPRAGATPDPA